MNNTNTTPARSQDTDMVLSEVWRIKEEIAAEHDYDVRKIAAAAIEAQKQYSDRIVDRSKVKAEKDRRANALPRAALD